MNTHLKKVGFYLIGALIGALAGTVIADHFFPEWEEEVLAEDVTDPNQPEFDWKGSGELAPNEVLADLEPFIVKAEKTKQLKKHKPKDYAGISNKIKPPVEVVAKEYLGEDAVVKDLVVDPTLPHVIALDQYAAFDSPHDKFTYSYYEDDDTLTDEANNIITDHEYFLGEDALLKFGQGSMDPDVVYIRNAKIHADYEIVRVHATYTQAVLGMPEVKPVSKSRRTRKVNKLDDTEDE